MVHAIWWLCRRQFVNKTTTFVTDITTGALPRNGACDLLPAPAVAHIPLGSSSGAEPFNNESPRLPHLDNTQVPLASLLW